jgi:hypothetical protein
MAEILCSKCGCKILSNEKYCIRCGTHCPFTEQSTEEAVSSGGAQIKATESLPNSPVPPSPPGYQQSAQSAPVNPAAPITRKPVPPFVFIIISCVLLLGALGFAASQFLFNTPVSRTANALINVAAIDNATSLDINPDSFSLGAVLSETPPVSSEPAMPSATPAPYETLKPTTTPAQPAPSAATVLFSDIIGQTGVAAITEDQAIQMFGQPLSRELGQDDADYFMDLKYNSFTLTFTVINGITTTCEGISVFANPCLIGMCDLAIGMNVDNVKTKMTAAQFVVESAYNPEYGAYEYYKNAFTGHEIAIEYVDGIVTGYFAMMSAF